MQQKMLWTAVATAIVFGGCSAGPTKQVSFESTVADLAVALDVRDTQVTAVDGDRAIFLHLSRVPDSVEHSKETDPPRIILDIKGPTGTADPEEVVLGHDDLVSRFRITRAFGVVHVEIDLDGSEVPAYSVHTLSDWIMIRMPYFDRAADRLRFKLKEGN